MQSDRCVGGQVHNGPTFEQILRLRLHNTVRFPAMGRNVASLSIADGPDGSPIQVLKVWETQVISGDGEKDHRARIFLVEDVIAVFKPDFSGQLMLPCAKNWLLRRKDIIAGIPQGTTVEGVIFVPEETPMIVESSSRLPYLTRAAEEGELVDVLSSPGEGVCC